MDKNEWTKARAKFCRDWANLGHEETGGMFMAVVGWLVLLGGIGITFGMGPVGIAIGLTFIAVGLA